MEFPDTPQPTLDQLQLDLQEIKTCLLELNELQKLELLEIRRNRVANSKRLVSIGNRIVQLLLLTFIAGSGFFVYNQLEEASKTKINESFIIQVLGLALAGITSQQLFVNRKEQKNLDSEEEQASEDLVQKYKEIKETHSEKNRLTKD